MGLGLAQAASTIRCSRAGSQTIQFPTSLSQMRRQAAQAQPDKERMALGAGGGGAFPLAYETFAVERLGGGSLLGVQR